MARVTDKPFPEALRELLTDQDISQRELIRRTRRQSGWGSFGVISFMLSGEYEPTARALEAVAQALQVQPEYFAEYRLLRARQDLDPAIVGFDTALRNFKRR